MQLTWARGFAKTTPDASPDVVQDKTSIVSTSLDVGLHNSNPLLRSLTTHLVPPLCAACRVLWRLLRLPRRSSGWQHVCTLNVLARFITRWPLPPATPAECMMHALYFWGTLPQSPANIETSFQALYKIPQSYTASLVPLENLRDCQLNPTPVCLTLNSLL